MNPPVPSDALPTSLNSRCRKLAARVIATTDREHPADAVLRETLRAKSGLPRNESRLVSRAVFAWFRWRQWLDASAPPPDQIEAATALADRFAANPTSFPDDELVAKAAPAWIAEHVAVTPAWVRSLQSEPPLWLRARVGQGAALAEKVGDCQPAGPGRLADALRYCGERDLFRTTEFHAGEFELQDLHSQAVGWLCDPQPGETWWDACAGEGGKLLHLSALMNNRGLIWASDRAEWRLCQLQRRAARARVFNYRVAAWDGGPRPPTKTKFAGVLVDAPCSNLGTWQRNPHARWTTTPADVRELAALQLQLLTHAAPSVKPGGKLVYAVCTLTRAETEEVAAAFAARRPEFAPLTMVNSLTPEIPPAAQIWLRPEDRPANGMFIAAWQRAGTAGGR
jgi:16S rRNA (cytosine967-C5)-methyltransferase